jgi:cytochrome c peroxidase
MIRMATLSTHVLAACVLVAGISACTQSDPVDDTALDLTLESLVTANGQRPVSTFLLPDDGDFAALPQDPRNPLTPEKVALGRLLFHETALATRPRQAAGRGTYSCATCHHADAGFQAGAQRAISEGGLGWGATRRPNPAWPIEDVDMLPIRSPSALNGAWQRVMMWSGNLGANGPNAFVGTTWPDGSPEHLNQLGYDGLETQAIAALSVHRMDDLDGTILESNPTYVAMWNAVWPGEPVSLERMGLAIAAYERTLLANRAPFQRWLRGEFGAMSASEKEGAILFFGKAKCAECHTGPALNQMAFYALGMPDMPGVASDSKTSAGRGGFTGAEADRHTFKVPQLYNLADSPFLGHGGTFNSIRDVVEYYNAGIPAVALPPGRVTPQFRPLALTGREMDRLAAFLEHALRDPDLDRYVPSALPSGNCFPANDPEARQALGC